MRNIDSSEITKNIKEMCIEANHFLAPDMERVFKKAKENEESKLGCQILEQLDENLKIAAEDMIPICQDTGMAVVFIEIGQDVHIEGENLEDAINEGVRQGYVDGYLRKSVVSDPIIRENTKDNTPAVIHYSIVPGENIKITVAPKGFGSENMSKVFMLKPADGIEGVKDAVLTAVKEAGPNACPPMVVGVGIGGTFEKCAILAKKALARPADSNSEIPYVKELEEELLTKINKLGIGPGGLGGTQTALSVNVETYPTHIAGLPVAINICCHVNRHISRTIMNRNITAPLSDEVAKELKSGDYVYITGTIYTARDAAHKRMWEALEKGEELPIEMKNNIIYYMGPSPAREGRPIGSAGPTTASRMDKYAPKLLDLGLKGMIGKGKRSEQVKEAIVRNGSVYFAAVGGAGAILSKAIKKSEVIAYDDLGTEAIRKLYVEDFPAIVVIDSQGNNLYETAIKEYAKQ
jgi:fumarate hydratase subunit alpha